MADQLIGEVLAMLEDVQGAGGQPLGGIQLREPLRVGNHLFHEMLEAVAAASQGRLTQHLGKPGRALIEQPDQTA